MELRERLASVNPASTLGQDRDVFAEVRNRIHGTLIEELGPQLASEDADQETLRTRVRSEIRRHLASEPGLSSADRERLAEEITDDALGAGPLEPLLADDSVTEIMVNGPADVWVERAGRLYETNVRFTDDAHLRRIINKIVGQIGRRVDESSPDGGRAPPRRQPRQRDHPAAVADGPAADDPQVQPHAARHSTTSSGSAR